MSLTCPPASHVEERQYRLCRRSLRARNLSDHRHARPVSILTRDLLLGHHYPVVAGFGALHICGTMGDIVLVERPVLYMEPVVLCSLFFVNDRTPNNTTLPR